MKILILEDDEMIVSMLHDIIGNICEEIGREFVVRSCDTVDEANAHYEAFQPDLFISDNQVNGPALGHDLLQVLKNHPHQAVKLFHSGDMWAHRDAINYFDYVVPKGETDSLLGKFMVPSTSLIPAVRKLGSIRPTMRCEAANAIGPSKPTNRARPGGLRP